MKVKFRFSGRGGQGIKFLGSALVRVAMVANLNATLTVDYTRSDPIAYPYCEGDADYFIALDQKGFERAAECISENTASYIDSDSIDDTAERTITKGKMHRVPITRRADDLKVTGAVNVLSLGFLSEHLKKSARPELSEEQYIQVFNGMRNPENNIKTFQRGKDLYQEIVGVSS